MLLDKIKFRDNYEEIAVKLFENHYSDLGISYKELALLLGIEESIIIKHDNWFKLDDGFYFYKNYGIFEELFLSELAQECRVRCVIFNVAYELFGYDGERPLKDIGVISKLYRTKDKQYYMYREFCQKYFGHVENDIDFFRRSSLITFGGDKTDKLMDDVFSMISFDMFTGQWDRKQYNLFFECDGDNNVRIAPLCDNGSCFQNGFDYESPFGCFLLTKGDENNQFLDACYNYFLNLLVNEVLLYDKFSFLLDIDIKEILKRTIDKYRILMSDSEQDNVLSYFDDRKRAIEHTLKLSRNSR